MKGVYVLGGCRNRLNEKDCYKVVLKSKTVNNKKKKTDIYVVKLLKSYFLSYVMVFLLLKFIFRYN